jgi:16S rRNA (cytidine1402-2'-O)-methyltransferase
LNIAPSLLQQAAAAATGGQHHPPGTLYVVATPIGNLADITLRAVFVLGLVDAVACEDTRVTGQLLRHLGLDKPLVALHQHNEHEAARGVVDRLAQGQRVAYASDAGTPAISDPGAVLVAAVAAAGLRVLPIPGASSTVAALSAAGDTGAQGFAFIGFLPGKGGERRSALLAAATAPGCQVLFEAPHRIEALADGLADAAPARRITLCRELTKQFETIATMAAAELPGWLAADANRSRGEFVLVLHALPPPAAPAAHSLPAEAERLLGPLLRELPLKQAVALAAELSGAPRNAIYQRALALRQAAAGGDAEAADERVDERVDKDGQGADDRRSDPPGIGGSATR